MPPRIIMVYPQQGFSGIYVKHLPLSLLYASINVVKAGYDVVIFDQRLHPADWRERLAELLTPETLAVGISVMSGAPIRNAQAIGRFVKKAAPDVRVVWGGPHANFYPDTILRDERSVDFVVSGYASVTFHQLADVMAAGRAPEGVSGITWRGEDGAIRRNEVADKSFEIVDYREIPYHLIADYSPYGQLDDGKVIFSMYSAVGCPYQCTFCSSPAQYANIQGKKWVALQVSDIVDHIQYLVATYGANYIYFIDDDSFPNLKHVEGIIDEITRRDIHVRLGFRGARINEVKRMSDEFISKLAAAGTDIMHIGAECGSDRILALLKKNCTVADIIECNRKLARHPEIRAAYNFIMGIPSETMEELHGTRDLMLQLVKDHPNCLIFPPNKFRPLPGTELYDVAREQWGYEMPSTLEAWANIEVESETTSAGWYGAKMKAFFNLMLICSYFIDNKIMRVTQGKTLFYKLVRLANVVYRPVALFRLRRGLSSWLVEYHLYRIFTGLLARADKGGS
jgi:anaerobic magnesium-protoporphyrin IX monomethyl ester cyclase